MRYLLLVVLFISHHCMSDEFNPTGIPSSEIKCLALNIYYEARDQPNRGQLAVAFVTHNRMVDNKNQFRKRTTYCSVVHQGYKRGRRDCHFSWYCDGKSDIPRELKKWKQIRDFAFWFVYNVDYIIDPTDGATHYHNLTVEPWWVDGMVQKGIIANHLFWTNE